MDSESKWEDACVKGILLITKLTDFLESKDGSLVLNTTVGDSYIQDDSDEDIPITVQDLSIVMESYLTCPILYSIELL